MGDEVDEVDDIIYYRSVAADLPELDDSSLGPAEVDYELVFEPSASASVSEERWKALTNLAALNGYLKGERKEIVAEALFAGVDVDDAEALAAYAAAKNATPSQLRDVYERWGADLFAATEGAADRAWCLKYVARQAQRPLGDVLQWYYGRFKRQAA